ncbi:MbnP family protein [Spirosoma sp. SC4-14]|uniref:MbnP family protein n=1 Tax=Spirosoma sp. SC4-14 TaxID=3128900 RepID=UPI0030CC030C
MKKYLFFSLFSALIMGWAVVACNETNPYVAPDSYGSLSLAFTNVAGSQAMNLNTNTYQNAVGESFTVTKFNYFISNIQLQKDDGSVYTLPQESSYFLVEAEKPESQTMTLTSIPSGNYTGMTFLIGVDSTRSLADISLRTGVLDPALNDGMYWEWNSGYIFMKLEGTSPSAPAAQNNAFFYHIGGFGGGYNGKKTINNLRTVTLTFNGDVVKVDSDLKPQVRLKTDVLKVFNGSTKLSISQYPSVMFDTYSTNIANNYASMFSYGGQTSL